MYTTPCTTLANICKCIPIQFLIFFSFLTYGHGFVIHSEDGTTTSEGDYVTFSTTTEPGDYVANWSDALIGVALAIFVLCGIVAFFLIARRTWRKALQEENEVDDYHGQYNRNIPYSRQEFVDSPRPQQTEFYNRRSSLHDGFMAQLAIGRNQTATQIRPEPVPVHTNERPPQQIIRTANDTIYDPPAYDAAVQESVGSVLPRKSILEAASFDSDISIIESPPSYFMVQENLSNTEASMTK